MNTKASIVLTLLLIFFFSFSTLSNATMAYNPKRPGPYVPRRIPPKLPPPNPFCPRDAPKLGTCLDLLGGVLGLVTGTPMAQHQSKCCSALEGLADKEAAGCLCTAAKESVLGITADWSVGISLVVSACKKEIPDRFKCV